MKNNSEMERTEPEEEPLPYPDSDWLPGLQRTIKRKLDAGEIGEADVDTFHGMMRQIVQEKDNEK